MGYTAYITYMLSSEKIFSDVIVTSGTTGTTGTTLGLGYKPAIHCNYIHSLHFDDLSNKEFNIYFENPDDWKFLSVSGTTGFTAHYLYVLVQLIDDNAQQLGIPSDEWRIFDVTNQIQNYVSGQTLSPSDLTWGVFRIPVSLYNLAPIYNLDYLNYPKKDDENTLGFGEETFFFGNVKTHIEAVAYTMDAPIILSLNEFNSTTNNSWDNESDILISEIGIYDNNNNLVAIAKLNSPIRKNENISRTIAFEIDF